jgi:hypothetical protein
MQEYIFPLRRRAVSEWLCKGSRRISFASAVPTLRLKCAIIITRLQGDDVPTAGGRFLEFAGLGVDGGEQEPCVSITRAGLAELLAQR